MNNEITVVNNSVSFIDSIDTSAVVSTMKKIATLQAVVQKTLKDGHDYGVIPGTSKPTMFKPGGEKICMMFGLTPHYDFMDKIENYKDGFFAYNVKCTLYKEDKAVSQGVGSCNNYEKKYRYINSDTIPEGVDPSTVKSFTNKYGQTKYKIDNPDPYDLVNTILKMAKKRAFVDAVLQVASLSEVFTQDLEDMRDYIQEEQQASTTNMTIEEAKAIKVNFGKYKGKLLGDLSVEDSGYFSWLTSNARDTVIKKACEIILKEEIEVGVPDGVDTNDQAISRPRPTPEEIDSVMDEGLPF